MKNLFRSWTAPPAPGKTSPWEHGLQMLFLAVILVAAGVLAGQQIASPNQRVLQAVAGGVIVFLAFRAQSISALALAVLLLPFPKGTSYGNTNVAFVLLIFLVWIFRTSTKQESPPRRTPLDIPILGLVMAYCLSFYNVVPETLPHAWSLFLNFLTYLLVLYLVVNIVRTTDDVKKIIGMHLASSVLVCLFAVYEQSHPGATIIPGWIEFGATEGMTSSIRVGSTFLDYELFGEYCALNLFLQLFLWTRASSRSRRWALSGIILLTLFCLFSTVTRGAILSFLAGSVYLVWLTRRRLNFVKLVGIVFLGTGAILGGDYVVSNFTNSDSVMERMFKTTFEHGVPDTRSGAWKQAVGNILDHPLIGHGPHYASRVGVEVIYWPHNVYLYYAYIVGIIGLAFYLWILWELWKSSRPRAPSLGAGSYIDGLTVVARVMLFTFMIDQIKIDYLRNQRYSFFVWYLFGLIWVISRVARDEAQTRFRVVESVPRQETESGPAALRPPGVAARPAIQRVSSTPAIGRP